MIVKEKLASLPMGYCIGLMDLGGERYCITASEDRGGGVLLIHTQTKRVQRITGLAGGIMSILPIPEEEGGFLAIQRFYPVFDSARAEIVHGRLKSLGGETLAAEVRTVAELPYVHRIALTGAPGARGVLAATLCRSKAFTNDWSQPGAVYEYRLDRHFQAAGCRLLLDGIHQNHGMYEYRREGGSDILVAGEEGVWAVDARGGTQKLCGEAVGDLCMYDVDGDGTDEMICITPFHGDRLRILKKGAQDWQTLAEEPVNFGHAVWGGSCGGAPVVLACSRGGDRAIALYRPVWERGHMRLERAEIDADVGASNIAVRQQGGAVVLYAANHGRNETARYTITL